MYKKNTLIGVFFVITLPSTEVKEAKTKGLDAPSL